MNHARDSVIAVAIVNPLNPQKVHLKGPEQVGGEGRDSRVLRTCGLTDALARGDQQTPPKKTTTFGEADTHPHTPTQNDERK
jgi:hypothetical protein